MKLLHFSDLHIGMENYTRLDPETGLSTRLLDFFKTFDFIVEKAFEEQVDAVIFAGDAYKTRDPNPTQQRGFGERIKILAKKIPVVLVVGNHDTPNAEGKANTLDIYSALEIENVWVSRFPELLQIKTKSGNLQVITLPWLHKNDYKQVAEKLKLMYEKIKPPPAGGPAILASHAEIEGSVFGSEKGLAIGNDITIPLPLLQDKRISYVALGHIHKHQVLSSPAGAGPLIVYSGSPERIDFGEEKEEKGFIIVEILAISRQSSDKFETSYKFIPSGARKFLTVTVNLKTTDLDPTQIVLDEIKKCALADKIIRLVINIPAELDKDIEMDKIKKALSSAHILAGISRNIEKVEREKIDLGKDVESLTPIAALKKYFEAKKYSPGKQKELENYAAALLEN
ncbi:MAG: exonuclease SbcCD subunit D [Candidatus Daviesbacteria bacterium]|nr:exonuclease SbcCD subunit D [Candidatus Daviesbacteria bacterium]